VDRLLPYFLVASLLNVKNVGVRSYSPSLVHREKPDGTVPQQSSHNKDFMELQPVAQPVQPVAQPVAQPVKSSSSSDTKWAIEPRQSGMLELVIIGLWCQ